MRGEHDGGDDRHSGGGYRYIPFAFQYSGGVEALAGHRIERVEFGEPLPLAAGFAWIEQYLGEARRATRGFCACELRSPAQFTDSRLHRRSTATTPGRCSAGA